VWHGIWELVDIIPGQLLSEKELHASGTDDLRQLSAVTKGIW
jgi:hypothetical protein